MEQPLDLTIVRAAVWVLMHLNSSSIKHDWVESIYSLSLLQNVSENVQSSNINEGYLYQ